MAILQISKIQQRSGNLVDLPQLDDAEFGWATDAKRLFIGKTTPNENIEILTAYSKINFSQINGTVGNLNISNVTVADGQLLAYDGSEWVNRGGDAGGLLTLGDVSNVKITGGAIGYVLETDGLGNLSWTPKSTILSFIENVTKATTAVVTTTQDNFFTQGAAVTISDVPGMTQLNGNQYYVSIISANSFSLYSDSGLTTPVNSTGYTAFSYSTVSATSTLTDEITVGDSSVFSLNDPVVFAGDLGNSTIVVGQTYYIKTKPSGTKITISETAGGATFDPGTEASPTNARVYVPGGRALSVVSGGTSSLSAAGANTQIQYNDTNLLQGNADFTYNNSTKLLNLNGNANVGNLNSSGVVTASQLISNIATGTEPLTVTSTTRVSNLNVSYSNVSDFEVVTNQTTGTFYPVFVNSSATGNRALGANANISFNAATGNLSVTLLNVTSNANVGNLGASGVVAATGNISGGNLTTAGALSVTGNANVGNIGTGRVIATGNISGTQLISNVANGTAPFVVTSTTQVANLNVATAGSATNASALLQNTSSATTVYPTFTTSSANGNSSAVINTAISANLANGAIIATTFVGNVSGNISGTLVAPGANTQVIFNDAGNANAVAGLTFNKSTNLLTVSGNVSGGNLTTGGALSVTGNANVGNIGAATAIFTTANLSTINSGLMQNGNSNIAITANANITFTSKSNATLVITDTGSNINGTLNTTKNITIGDSTVPSSADRLTILSTLPRIYLEKTGTGNSVNFVGLNGGYLAYYSDFWNEATGSGHQWLVDGSQKMLLNADGNLGIANASPTDTLSVTGTANISGNTTSANLIATSYHIRSINAAVSAAGTTQGTATALTKEINVVSTVATGAGVVLPTAVAGMVLIVNNTSANTLNVYPATSGIINSGAANAAYSHPAGASIQYYATSGTQWYTVGATFA